MNKTRSPPWKKQTPTYHPELLEIWQNMYKELHIENGIGKSKALEMIGAHYGVSRQTVMFHLIPQYKRYQKNFHSKRWSRDRENPQIRKSTTDYKVRYHKVRRHIDSYIRRAYQNAHPEDAISMEDLSYAIHDNSNILFKPETLLGLVKRLEATKRCPVLEEVFGYSVPHYRLSDKKRK